MSLPVGLGAVPKIAVIGCGSWGQNLVRNFAELGALAAVSDRNPGVEQKESARTGVPARPTVEILSDPAITAVVIAAPAEAHGALVEEALRADKHVFVEKPLALDVSVAERLCQLSAERGRILMVGHLLRYHPAFLRLQELAAKGRLGRIQYIASSRLNLGKFRSEENTLWSFAPHDISMILALLGDQIESVLATGHNYLHKAIADVTTTHIKFASGQAAHIHVSWLHPFKEQRLVVVGEKGMAVFDDGCDWPEKLRIYPHTVEWREGRPTPVKGAAETVALDPFEPLRLECQHFIECLQNGNRPRTDGAEGLRVLRVLDAAQRSMDQGRSVPMSPPVAAASANTFVHETAVVDQPALIGEGTRIWHFSHVLSNSHIGRNCVIGQNVTVGPDVTIGNNCKIQNNVSVYKGVVLEDGVFCGPSMVFTNVKNPRAEVERKHAFMSTRVCRGATIGANATIICGTTIGRYAMIGAGAVVSRDVPDYALVVGNPARVIGHSCSCGERLPDPVRGRISCQACGSSYYAEGDALSPLDLQRA